MSKAVVMGNGESRSWYNPNTKWADVRTWGCNAVYRDAAPDNLVAMDSAMKYEIHASGYPKQNKCWFSSWHVVDSMVIPIIKSDCGVPEYFIHENENKTGLCVLNEYKSNTLKDLVDDTLKQYPNYSMDEVHSHLISKNWRYKDAGYWISYVSEKDKIESVEEDFQSAGCAALSLACREGAREVYMLGFDMQNSDSLYRGTSGYVSDDIDFGNENSLLSGWTKCMSSVFDQYKEATFYWVDCQITSSNGWHGSSVRDYHSNVRLLSKEEFCKELLLNDYK